MGRRQGNSALGLSARVIGKVPGCSRVPLAAGLTVITGERVFGEPATFLSSDHNGCLAHMSG